MAVIYLIRHGQASFGKEDYDLLSSLGEQQASILGECLQPRVASAPVIIAGTMKRHHQTRDLSGLKNQFPDAKLLETPDWNEYDHQQILGKFDSRMTTAAGTREVLSAEKNPALAFARIFSDATARWQSGDFDEDYTESWLTFKTRVKQGVDLAVSETEGNDTVFVFTSGGPISVVTQHLLGLPDPQILSVNWTLANCGITKLVKTRNRLFLSSLNDHSHFDFPDKQDLITYK